MEKYFAIIPAAGIGTRFSSETPKQYHRLNGITLLEHSINALLKFKPLIQLIVAVHPEDQYWKNLPYHDHPKVFITAGGEKRSKSVLKGLEKLNAQAEDWVIIHDAVRPYLHSEDLFNLIHHTQHHPVGGILAKPVSDTLKYASRDHHIEKTIPRDYLYHALTPQCFRFGKLKNALNKTQNLELTDEAMALELMGEKSLLVMCKKYNAKITYPEDLISFN